MAYIVLPNALDKFGPRKGLEGPYNFSGRVLYYDPHQGQYYDPLTDWYVEYDEMAAINKDFMDRLARA
jgi:hypothetical protein